MILLSDMYTWNWIDSKIHKVLMENQLENEENEFET